MPARVGPTPSWRSRRIRLRSSTWASSRACWASTEVLADPDRLGRDREVVDRPARASAGRFGESFPGPGGDDDLADSPTLVVERHRRSGDRRVVPAITGSTPSTVISTDPRRELVPNRDGQPLHDGVVVYAGLELARRSERPPSSGRPPGRTIVVSWRRPRHHRRRRGHDGTRGDHPRDRQRGRVVEQAGQDDQHGRVDRGQRESDDPDQHRSVDEEPRL